MGSCFILRRAEPNSHGNGLGDTTEQAAPAQCLLKWMQTEEHPWATEASLIPQNPPQDVGAL